MSEAKIETGPNRRSPVRIILVLLPLILFSALAAVFFYQLTSGRKASTLPSVLIGKPAPVTVLSALKGLNKNGSPIPGIGAEDLIGKVTVLNVFASWCVPCRAEHPLLMELGKDTRFQMFGIDYKERKPGAGLSFLNTLGNPFDAVGEDLEGRAVIDWGVYGVPESFIVDRSGTIVYKHVGPLNGTSFALFKQEIEKALAN